MSNFLIYKNMCESENGNFNNLSSDKVYVDSMSREIFYMNQKYGDGNYDVRIKGKINTAFRQNPEDTQIPLFRQMEFNTDDYQIFLYSFNEKKGIIKKVDITTNFNPNEMIACYINPEDILGGTDGGIVDIILEFKNVPDFGIWQNAFLSTPFIEIEFLTDMSNAITSNFITNGEIRKFKGAFDIEGTSGITDGVPDDEWDRSRNLKYLFLKLNIRDEVVEDYEGLVDLDLSWCHNLSLSSIHYICKHASNNIIYNIHLPENLYYLVEENIESFISINDNIIFSSPLEW